jgi:hypothetical protein
VCEPVTDDKRMRLRYAAACRVCWAELPDKVSEAMYEPTTKTVRCLRHDAASISNPTFTVSVRAGQARTTRLGTPVL